MFNQTGGTHAVTLFFYLGGHAGSSGTYNLSGGLLNGSWECIGGIENGTFNHTGGTNSGSINIGFYAGLNGTYNISGSAVVNSTFTRIGYEGSGTVNQTGGLVRSSIYFGDRSGSSGVYNLEGGTLRTSGLSKGYGSAQFNFGGGTLQASGDLPSALDMTLTGKGGDAKIDTAGRVVTLSGVLSGEGGLEKRGAGTLILSGKNTYLGETSVLAGVLQILGDYTTGGKISVANGAGIVFRDAV